MARKLEQEPSSKQLNTGALAAAAEPASLGSVISGHRAVGETLVRGLPFITSAPRGGGGPKIGRFCGKTLLKMRMKGERGSKISKILRTS